MQATNNCQMQYWSAICIIAQNVINKPMLLTKLKIKKFISLIWSNKSNFAQLQYFNSDNVILLIKINGQNLKS